MKKSKAVLLGVCVLALVVVFAGCSKKAESTGSGSGEQKVIEFWHIQSTEPLLGIIQRSVDRFMKDNPDVKVNVNTVVNDAYKQKLAIAMASGQLPDVFISWSGGPMYEYAKAGNIIDLTPYFNQNDYKAKFLDAGIDQATWQSKIWGMPVDAVTAGLVFYNKENFQKWGVTPPSTITEFEALCNTLKNKGITPFSLANKTQWTGSMYFMYLATRHGGTEPFIRAVDGSGSFEDPAFIYAGQKIQEWVQKGFFNDGFNGLDEDSGQARSALYTGDAAMHVMGSWFIATVMDENPEWADQLGMFTFPRDETGVGDPDTVIGTIGDNFYHISSTCKYPEETFKLLTYLLDDAAVQERLSTGRIPPLKDLSIADPRLAELTRITAAAPSVQLWYDQSLSPAVADVHKSTSQEIFGLTMTPEEAAKQLQAAQADYLKK
jgi:raffinose/stachyose/melibiose transport system substrate-binding protein